MATLPKNPVDYTDPYGLAEPMAGDILVSGGTHKQYANGSWNTASLISFDVPEDSVVRMGDDFQMTGKEFKTCMKMLLKMTMEKCPEEFI